MNRIVAVKIIPSYNGQKLIQFFSEYTFENNFWTKTYKPSYQSFDILRRIIFKTGMNVDLDLNSGIITCIRRDYEKENSTI